MTDARLVMLEGRRVAEARLTDGCRIRTGESASRVLNEATGLYNETTPVYSYTGPCLVKFGATQPRLIDAAGQLLTLQEVEVHLPVTTSTEVRPGHVVEILASATDAELVGLQLRVTGIHAQTFATARRLPVEVIS